MVDHHNPGGGHWLAAGLSPQVSYGALLIFIRFSKLNNVWHNDIQWNHMQFFCCNNFRFFSCLNSTDFAGSKCEMLWTEQSSISDGAFNPRR